MGGFTTLIIYTPEVCSSVFLCPCTIADVQLILPTLAIHVCRHIITSMFPLNTAWGTKFMYTY